MKPGNISDSLICYLKTETAKLLKDNTYGRIPCYHRCPDKDYLPYIHMKLWTTLELRDKDAISIVSLYDEYKEMENSRLKWVYFNYIVILLNSMMDPPKMSGKNPITKERITRHPLTLKQIPLVLEKESFGKEKTKRVEDKINEIETAWNPYKKWRNEKVVHTDLSSTILQDKINLYTTFFGSYSWMGEKEPGDTRALGYKQHYKELDNHLDILKQENGTGIFDHDIKRIENHKKWMVENVYDPVSDKHQELYDIGDTYDEINKTISEVIDLISDLLNDVGKLCKERYGKVFTPA
ncbi:MAG: hypothetical protein OXH56_06510 [Gemmatimonadetes bacterium]|nr:hypothetical protein [Gemmatimonadota bacterium]